MPVMLFMLCIQLEVLFSLDAVVECVTDSNALGILPVKDIWGITMCWLILYGSHLRLR